LKIEDLQVSCDGDTGKATFKQAYTLTNFKIKKVADTSCEVCNMQRTPIITYQDSVNKELQFQNESSDWKIIRELVK